MEAKMVVVLTEIAKSLSTISFLFWVFIVIMWLKD